MELLSPISNNSGKSNSGKHYDDNNTVSSVLCCWQTGKTEGTSWWGIEGRPPDSQACTGKNKRTADFFPLGNIQPNRVVPFCGFCLWLPKDSTKQIAHTSHFCYLGLQLLNLKSLTNLPQLSPCCHRPTFSRELTASVLMGFTSGFSRWHIWVLDTVQQVRRVREWGG